MLNVQIINKSKHPLPAYATELSAGMDIRANLNESISLAPMQRCLVPTGLYIALPEGFEAQVRPRSGLAIKKGITVLNSPGTIDADYRGEVCIILVNLSAETFVIEDGERIAQMVIARHEQALWQEVEVLDETERGAVCIILVNLSAETFVIEDGERIAQMVIARHEQALWQEVEVLDETERGAGGFGHTGKK